MNLIKRMTESLRIGLSRFYVAFGSAAAFFITTVLFIIFDDSIVLLKLTMSFALLTLLTAFVKIISERFSLSAKILYLLYAISALPYILCYLLLGDKPTSTYTMLGYIGVIVIMIVAVILAMYDRHNSDKLMPHIIKSILFSAFIALIIFGGIEICLAAVKFLIYDFSDTIFLKTTFILLSLAFELVFIGLVLSSLPSFKEEITIPKAFRIIVLNVMFPVYLLLIAVLYVYLLKILFTMNMPGGQINWFASFAELFFIFFSYTLFQYENRAVLLWKRFGGLIMLPIIAVQSIAVYIRVSAYGLTTARWVSILFTFAAVVFILLTLIKEGKFKNLAAYVFIALLAVSTLTPFNFVDVPVYEQTARLEGILTRLSMFDGENITPNSDISAEDKQEILSCYNEIRYSDKAPVYMTDKPLYELFGFNYEDAYQDNSDNRVYIYTGDPIEIDISGYNRMLYISVYTGEAYNDLAKVIESGENTVCLLDGRLMLVVDGNGYDITDFIISLDESDSDTLIVYDLNDDIRLYFIDIVYQITEDKITDYSIVCRVFVK